MIKYFKILFQKFFGKKILIKDVDSLLSEYKKINDDIKYLDTQQETFILASLERDFPYIKNDICSIHEKISNGEVSTDLWAPENFNRMYDKTSVKLVKYREDGKHASYTSNKIKIEFNFNSKLDSKFKLDSLYVYVGNNLVSVSMDKFTDILFKYVIAFEINTSAKSLKSSKKAFNSMMDILGNEVKRDSKIDDILN